MKKLLFDTKGSGTIAIIARIAIGIVLFPHGAQKLLGWFGGYGFSNTMQFFTETAGLPWHVGFLVIIIEFFGSISLLIGFATRVWTIALIALTLGIIFHSHIQNGFFMNWEGNQKGEGIEYFLLLLALSIISLYSGSGRGSVDKAVERSVSR